jgi:hypothetical protein
LTGNAQLEWAEIAVAAEDSPVYGWSVGLVERSLRNRSASCTQVKPSNFFVVTIFDFARWFLDGVIVPAVPFLKTHALIMLGEPGGGKTIVCEALASTAGFAVKAIRFVLCPCSTFLCSNYPGSGSDPYMR